MNPSDGRPPPIVVGRACQFKPHPGRGAGRASPIIVHDELGFHRGERRERREKRASVRRTARLGTSFFLLSALSASSAVRIFFRS
jgi:hypothetical protein